MTAPHERCSSLWKSVSGDILLQCEWNVGHRGPGHKSNRSWWTDDSPACVGNLMPFHQRMQSSSAVDDMMAELARARTKFPTPFHSPHEGWAILMEEVEELKREAFWGVPADRRALMRKEAIQCAAMALRFVEDCCDTEQVSNTGMPN